jgi:hypothetical protein
MKYKLVYIEWEDAVDDTSLDWKTKNEVFEWVKDSKWIIKQSGFILKEDKTGIVFASKMEQGNEKYEATFRGISRIPKTWIRKRKVLKV